VVAAVAATIACWGAPTPASASIPCKATSAVNGLAGKACEALTNPGKLLTIGKSLITGHLGTAINQFLGGGGVPTGASAALSLAAIGAWIMGGAKAAVIGMVNAIQRSAVPQLASVWFSSTYWRVAGIAALLTLPFLFAAAVQGLMRSDLSVLTRAAFGYLPLAMLCVGIAAPLTMLLLAATDELCKLVWSPGSSHGLTSLLTHSSGLLGIAVLIKSRFLAFLFGLFTAGGAVLVWLELLMREAAVYVVVLLLPLAFAALVWPARRIWALRATELMVALILSKFAIVAVLGLGGVALDHAGSHGVGAILAGVCLVILSAFAPWAVLRLVPLSEVASGAASALRDHAVTPITAAWHASQKQDRVANAILPDLSGRAAAAATGASPLVDGKTAFREDANEPAVDFDLMEELDQGPLAGAFGPAGNGHLGAEESTATPGATTGAPEDSAEDERVPGAAPMWQAPDMSWRPLTLGMDDGWPPPPLWAEGGGREPGGQAASRPEQAPTAPPAGPAPEMPGPSSADEPDPLPPPQGSGGRL
jgi:hypothetical protein